MGFFDSLSKGWTFMKEAFAMARADRSLLKPSLYQVLVSIVYWVAWVVALIAADVDMESGSGQLLGAVAVFGSFLIFYFFCGMTVNMVDVYLRGGKPSVSEGFRDARQNFVAICFLALVSTIVELLAKAVRRQGREGGAGGAVLAILASIIESVWTVISFLLLPAIIIEDCSLGDALRRVKQISKGNYLLIGIGEIGVRFVTNLIGFAMMLVLFFVLWVSFDAIGGTGGTVLGLVLGGTILSLFAAFATYLRMAYYTCLYLWASDVEKNGPSAQAPLPLARTMNR